jgi:hypothetical protein
MLVLFISLIIALEVIMTHNAVRRIAAYDEKRALLAQRTKVALSVDTEDYYLEELPSCDYWRRRLGRVARLDTHNVLKERLRDKTTSADNVINYENAIAAIKVIAVRFKNYGFKLLNFIMDTYWRMIVKIERNKEEVGYDI